MIVYFNTSKPLSEIEKVINKVVKEKGFELWLSTGDRYWSISVPVDNVEYATVLVNILKAVGVRHAELVVWYNRLPKIINVQDGVKFRALELGVGDIDVTMIYNDVDNDVKVEFVGDVDGIINAFKTVEAMF